MELKIDPEFKSLIPPLTDAEFKQLKENIVEDGEILNPIITWNGIIIDGHNRWKILQEYPDFSFRTHEMIFLNRYEAKEWIIKNQLGRRNITNEQRFRLIGQMQENRKKAVGEHKGNQYSEKKMELVQNEPIPKSTAEAIAKEVGVSESTVKRAEKFSKGIDGIQEVSPKAAEKILAGGSGITKVEVMNVPKMDVEERKSFVERVINPVPKAEANKQSTQERRDNEPTYTISNLLEEITSSSDNFIRFLKGTLVKRSTVYAERESREQVYKAIEKVKSKIGEIENIIK